MEQKPEDNEQLSFKELVVANSIQVDALTQLLIEKVTVITGSFNFTKVAEEKNAENSLIISRGNWRGYTSKTGRDTGSMRKHTWRGADNRNEELEQAIARW